MSSKASGPDRGRSWVIALSCCFINMMFFGLARLAGVLFVASVQQFGISRQRASFPYSLSSCVRNLSGPLVGYLGHRFGVRYVVISGSILASIGIASCFFAADINYVTILWGVVFGVGFGMGNIILPIPINQYFDKHRGTASGISFSGACFGSFILPSIVEALLDAYGLHGTFLVLAGLVLNCVPAAMILRKPKFTVNNSKKLMKDVLSSGNQSVSSANNAKLFIVEDTVATNLKPLGNVEESLTYQNDDLGSNVMPNFMLQGHPIEWMVANPALSHDERVQRLSTQTLLSDYSIRMSCSEPVDYDYIMRNSKGKRTVTDAHSECDTCSVASGGEGSHGKVIFDDVFENSSIADSRKSSQLNGGICDDCKSIPEIHEKCSETVTLPLNNHLLMTLTKEKDPIDSISNLVNDKEIKIKINKNESLSAKEVYCNLAYQSDISEDIPSQKVLNTPKKPQNSTLDQFKVFLDPTFVLLTLIYSFYCFIFVCMITIVVDFARDIGVESYKEKYILMSFSIGDLVGRLGLCWITDRGYMTKCGFASLCFLCQAVSTVATVFCSGINALLVVFALYGLSEAGFIVVFPLIIAQFIEEDKHTVAIPSSSFLSGPACLAVAPLIGIFREDIGSYNGIFYLVGIISILCSLCFLLVPSLANCRKKNK